LIERNILKTAREKRHITFRGTKIRIVVYFSSESMQGRRNRPMSLKYWRKRLQPSILYSAKRS